MGSTTWNYTLLIGTLTIPYLIMWNWMVGLPVFAVFLIGYYAIHNEYMNRFYRRVMGLFFLDSSIYRDKSYKESKILAFSRKPRLEIGVVKNEPAWYSKLVNSALVKIQRDPDWKSFIDKHKPLQNPGQANSTSPSPSIPIVSQTATQTGVIPPTLPTDMNAYMIILDDPVSFSDTEKHTFDRCVILTRRPFEKEIAFQQLALSIRGYPVDVQAAEAKLICIAWIADDFPILRTKFTDVDAYEEMDATSNTPVNSNDLELEVMRRIIYYYRSYMVRFDRQIDEMQDNLDNSEEISSKRKQLLLMERKKNTSIAGLKYFGNPASKASMILAIIGWILVAALVGVIIK